MRENKDVYFPVLYAICVSNLHNLYLTNSTNLHKAMCRHTHTQRTDIGGKKKKEKKNTKMEKPYLQGSILPAMLPRHQTQVTFKAVNQTMLPKHVPSNKMQFKCFTKI